jgi:AcrR family transcriptional regulator
MENDTCHFLGTHPKRGRPRRGTEPARTEALIHAATRVFLREGYGLASIDKVASEAGVSTRTIYERFRNKADLLGAVISRLVNRMSTVLATAELNRLTPRAALTVIAETITGRVREPDSAALFRIVAMEALRGHCRGSLFPRSSQPRRLKPRRSGQGCTALSADDLFRTAGTPAVRR